MAESDKSRLIDGYTSMEDAVDSDYPPALISPAAVAWAVNLTFRDVWPQPRPPLVHRDLQFDTEELRSGLQDGLFQGAGTYNTDDGRAFIVLSVSGRIFSIEVTANYRVATPADWQQGQDCIIWPALPDTDAERLFPGGGRKLRPSLLRFRGMK